MKRRKFVLLFLCLTLVMSMFSACGKKTGNGGTSSDSKGMPEKSDETELTYVYSSDTTDWNYLTTTDNTPGMYIDTLVEYDYLGLCQPCLAESWEHSDDGLTWTFHIRKGVKWMTYDQKEYGADVTAHDFVTSCSYILDPANGSQLADMMFTIKGAEDYYNQKMAGENPNFEDVVGCKAEDDYTLVYTLEKPIPYFLSSTTYKNFMPANKKHMEELGDRWSTDNQTMLYNGEYIMTEYVPQGRIESVLNPTYWDSKNMHITAIHQIYNAEATTVQPEMFLRGEVNYADIPTEQLDEWLNDPSKKENIRPCRPSFFSYYWQFNFNPQFDKKYEPDNWKLAVNNINFRKSVMHAMNKKAIVQVDDPYNYDQHIANSIVPKDFVSAEGVDYTQLGKLKELNEMDTFDLDKAKEYKEKAMEELKAQGAHFPIIIFMPYDTGSTLYTQRIQVVEQMLEKNLGTDYIDIQTEGYPDDGFSNATQRACNYAMQRCTWMADYLDPLSYTDPFRILQSRGSCIYMADGMAEVSDTQVPGSYKGQDNRFYYNIKYDDMVAEADSEVVDLNARYKKFADIEYWLCYDQCLVIPNMRGGTGYVASNLLPFESQYAPFGASNSRYKYQYIYKKGINTDEYSVAYEKWEKEREEKLKELATQGKVFGLDF